MLRWDEWTHLRMLLDERTNDRIAEVERPTRKQLDRYASIRQGKDI